MSKNTILTIVLILILVAVFLIIMKILTNKDNLGENNLLMSPVFKNIVKQKVLPSEVPLAVVAPKTFQFNSATDLKKELESINPTVSDSDFE